MNKAKRITKKQQYLNAIEHDLKYFESELIAGHSHIWWHGEKLTRSQVKREVLELRLEQGRVSMDSTYKPWVGLY
jgi:hypothetical protein